MRPYRCSVCGRILGITDGAKLPAQYCPDRPCCLYPPVTTSRSDDPTLASFILAVSEGTDATPYAITKALGKKGSYANVVADQQRQRWRKAT